MQPLNHLMHNPFIALVELCVLGRQDYFCLKENVGNGGGAWGQSFSNLSKMAQQSMLLSGKMNSYEWIQC